jgi:hypothetical protein
VARVEDALCGRSIATYVKIDVPFKRAVW